MTADRLPSFWLKALLTLAVVAAGDVLLFQAAGLGVNLGLLGLAAAAALFIANPAIRADRLAGAALLSTTLFALLQLERPTFVGWLLCLVALAVAALAPRAPPGEDGWRWLQRLVLGGLKALLGPMTDAARLAKARARGRRLRLASVALAAVLPLLGGAVFLWLFAAANPVIEQALARVRLPQPDIDRIAFWLALALPLWALLRPRGLRRTLRTPGLDGDFEIPGATAASIAASLAVFNLIFALQNGLDLAFLWSGAGLPEGVTHAEYAHRGAYPLIATALLAGLFVLVFLRPGSRTAASRPVRWLVAAWVAQNLFLVASTALRTLDYIEAYSLTRMRIAALLWMALVATGLVLVAWRLFRGRSSSWLINANLIAAAAVLLVCSIVDLGAVAAAWNVRHAREVGGSGVELDLCYMRELKGAALAPLAELERRPLPEPFRTRVEVTRRLLMQETREGQSAWTSWRFRDARRLGRVETLVGPDAGPPLRWRNYQCDGSPKPPPAAPLTPTPNPGT